MVHVRALPENESVFPVSDALLLEGRVIVN